MTKYLLLVIALGASLRTFAEEPKKNEEAKPSSMVTYKNVKGTKGDFALKLNVFNPPGHDLAKKRPCILLFHSGGWCSGEPSSQFSGCKKWASKGMVAIAVEYRIREKHGGTPLESVADGKSAIRWVRTHAIELGINPDMIAAGGSSAGGQVAAAAGILTTFEENEEDQTVSSKPNALVLVSPVLDNSPDGYGHYHKEVKKNWKAFSPLHNVEKGAPPTIICMGDNETKYLRVESGKEFQKKMSEVGSRCELFIYEGMTHTTRTPEQGAAIGREQAKFLSSLGYLTLSAADAKPTK